MEKSSECIELVLASPKEEQSLGVPFLSQQEPTFMIYIKTSSFDPDVHDHDYAFDMRCDAFFLVGGSCNMVINTFES